MICHPGHDGVHVAQIVQGVFKVRCFRALAREFCRHRAGTVIHAQKLIITHLANSFNDNYYHLHQDKEDAMKFLCPRHRRMFASLSLNEKNDLWLLWMEYAFTFSENHDSDKLVAATGSAFELACLARKHHPDCMQVELTLAAI